MEEKAKRSSTSMLQSRWDLRAFRVENCIGETRQARDCQLLMEIKHCVQIFQ